MLLLLLFCVLPTASLATPSSPPLAFREDVFVRCAAAPSNGTEVALLTARSKLECITLCFSTDRCRSVHVQTDVDSHHVVCSLRNDSPLSHCPPVTGNGHQSVDYLVQKTQAVTSTTVTTGQSTTSELQAVTTTEERTTTSMMTTAEESTTTPMMTTTEESTTTPMMTTTEESTTTPMMTTTEESTTTPMMTTTEESTTTPMMTTTEESTTTPMMTTAEESTTTPMMTTTEESTTTPMMTTTEESTTTPMMTTTEESTTTPMMTTTEESTTTLLMTTEEAETTELVCQNGGVLQVDGTCDCPLPFAGVTCSRYIRDCTEGYEIGHRSNDNEQMMIQPLASPSPFWVKCRFQWGGVTYPLIRTHTNPWVGSSWSQAKAGFGDNLGIVSNSQNYFIGLEKTRNITSQGEYRAHFFSMYNNWGSTASAFYTNFTMGPESDDYEVRYNSFFSGSDVADNALTGQLPKKFCTSDHDGAGCGQWGWYGSDCEGFGLLQDPLLWPVLGSPEQLNLVLLDFVRTSPFYDD